MPNDKSDRQKVAEEIADFASGLCKDNESKTIRLGPHNMLAIIVTLAVAAHYFL